MSGNLRLSFYLIGLICSVQDGFAQQEMIVIAHRGSSGYLPEHTREATCLAHAMNADYIEQDVVLTSDGVPIVLHDIQLDTVTNVKTVFPNRYRNDGRYYAIDFSIDEIRQLKVNERIQLKTGKPVFPKRFPLLESNFRVPTLEESISLILGLNKSTGKRIGIYPEIKKPKWHRDQGQDVSRAVLKVLTQHGYRSKSDLVYLQCFDPEELRRIRDDLGCSLKLVQLIGSNDWDEAETDYSALVTPAGLKQVAEYADGIGPWMPYVINDEGVVTELVERAHDVNLFVHPFTFRADALPEYATSFDELLSVFSAARIDGLFTDFPDQVIRFQQGKTVNKQ